MENPATCKNLEQTVCEEVPYDDCQEIHKLVSHQVIKYKPISSVPCFSRIGVDKYGIPAVEIAFPDGTTDRLNIGRFNNQEGRYLGKKFFFCKNYQGENYYFNVTTFGLGGPYFSVLWVNFTLIFQYSA